VKRREKRDTQSLTTGEIDSLLRAIGDGESGGRRGRLPGRLRMLQQAMGRLSPAASHKHLISTIPDGGDLDGVREVWFNDRIQVPIWAGPGGRLTGFRVYPEQELRRRGCAPFLEWSERGGCASSSPHPRVGWVRRQLRRASHGGFGAAQPWADILREVLRRWPRRWDRTLDMRDNGSRLAGRAG
jgi:hypothetical protein